ncbi:MAG TPA: hypothetical protein VGN12_06225 [Pirellulales bacterium]
MLRTYKRHQHRFSPVCVTLALLFGTVVLVRCVRAVDSAASSAEEPLLVTGTVVDADDRPAAGVKVTGVRWHIQTESTITGTDGRFELRIPREYAYDLALHAATADGSWQTFYSQPDHGERDELVADMLDLRLTLAPARDIPVRVVDAAGAPVAEARVVVISTYLVYPVVITDALGSAALRGPADLLVADIVAYKAGVGLDYVSYGSRRRPIDPKTFPPQPKSGETVSLTLAGAETVKIKLVDADGKPAAAVPLTLWLLDKPKQPQVNFSMIQSEFRAITNEDGVATFDWIPKWSTEMLQFWPLSGDAYARRRVIYDPAKDHGQVTARLERVVPISGHVRFDDGRPAPGINVVADGESYDLDDFRDHTKTDENGRFEFQAWPEQLCMIVVQDRQWAAAPRDGIVVRRGKPIDNLEIKLQPATRIHGRVTLGTDDSPIANQDVSLYQYGQDLNQAGEQIELPDDDRPRHYVRSMIVQWGKTDAEGYYEFFAGPGNFDVRGPSQTDIQKFTITDERDLTFDFVAPRPENGPFSGLVVTGNPPRPVPNAKVSGVYRSHLAPTDLSVTTDAEGRFELTRSLHPLVLFATSEDKTLAGVADATSDERHATIALNPVATARGRLVDAVTKKPLTRRELVYGTRVYMGGADAPWRTSGGGSTETDGEGRFTLEHIIVGRAIEVSMVTDPKAGRSRNVAEVRATSAQPIEFGDVIVNERQRPTPGLRDRVLKDFAAVEKPLAAYSAAVAGAEESHRRVLLVFADPVAGATQNLFEAFYETEGSIFAALSDYQMIPIDVARKKSEQGPKVARGRGIDLAELQLPVLYICDGDGRRLALADRTELMPQGIVDQGLLTSFLRKHAPPQGGSR